MTTTVVDLFSGLGGFSTGAKQAGCHVAWAGNHWPLAIEYHQKNHPATTHVCQDLQQFDFSRLPEHDLLLASPSCQGHSPARGAEKPHHDGSRSTAWAVVSAAEAGRAPVVIVENVLQFTSWTLYPAWKLAMESLGYSISPHILDAADFGVPQNRIRLFLVCTRSQVPLVLDLKKTAWEPIGPSIQWD
ncbi:MAG TPA: DNA cytosine methyltransferase, partial [Myxococcota bacterium]|nr:DNA cytosine methyltransferase [Myxococcota bacterium]